MRLSCPILSDMTAARKCSGHVFFAYRYIIFDIARVARPPDHPVFISAEGGRGVCLAAAPCCLVVVGAARLVTSGFWRAAAAVVGLPPSPCRLYPVASRVETSARGAPLTRRGRVPLPIAARKDVTHHDKTHDNQTIRRCGAAAPRSLYRGCPVDVRTGGRHICPNQYGIMRPQIRARPAARHRRGAYRRGAARHRTTHGQSHYRHFCATRYATASKKVGSCLPFFGVKGRLRRRSPAARADRRQNQRRTSATAAALPRTRRPAQGGRGHTSRLVRRPMRTGWSC